MDNQKVQLLLNTIYNYGVRDVCIGAGSRSTKLILMLNHLGVTVHPFFDERSVGYMALGIIKAKKAPVLIITTSGTAVSNLCPAVTEAFHDHLNLIVCSADRPPRYLGTGANQTINQVRIFNSLVDEVQVPENVESLSDLSQDLNQALSRMQAIGGPIHINCPLEDPVSAAPFELAEMDPVDIKKKEPLPHFSNDQLHRLNQIINQTKQGLLCIGQIETEADQQIVAQFAKEMGWPMVVDVTNMWMKQSPHAFYSTDALLINHSLVNMDTILYIGGRFVSKQLYLALAESKKTVIHIAEQYIPTVPNGHAIDAYQVAYSSLSQLTRNPLDNGPLVQAFNARIIQQIKLSIDEYPTSDLAYIYAIIENITEQTDIFIANSLPIRIFDHLYHPQIGQVHANRGASGIDGNISTIMGLCQTDTSIPLIAILGDLATLVDINALLMYKQCRRPLKIIVINNGGGDIFSMLPVSKQTDCFDAYFKMTHRHSIHEIASGFGLKAALVNHPSKIAGYEDTSIIECNSKGQWSEQKNQVFEIDKINPFM